MAHKVDANGGVTAWGHVGAKSTAPSGNLQLQRFWGPGWFLRGSEGAGTRKHGCPSSQFIPNLSQSLPHDCGEAGFFWGGGDVMGVWEGRVAAKRRKLIDIALPDEPCRRGMLPFGGQALGVDPKRQETLDPPSVCLNTRATRGRAEYYTATVLRVSESSARFREPFPELTRRRSCGAGVEPASGRNMACPWHFSQSCS